MVFSGIKILPSSQDEKQSIKNRSEFNNGFTVYDKSLMYGTDVLSCLNKAQSNNQKYVNNNFYGTDSADVGADARKELLIEVNVKLKNTIQEEVIVYYRNNQGKVIQEQSKEYNVQPFKPGSNTQNKFELPVITYYHFNGKKIEKAKTNTYQNAMWGANKNMIQNSKLKTSTFDTVLKGGNTYSILNDSTGQLAALLSTVTTPEQTIYKQGYSGSGNEDWYSATWKTAANDFKTRKFKCAGLGYSEEGYVNEVSFEEI